MSAESGRRLEPNTERKKSKRKKKINIVDKKNRENLLTLFVPYIHVLERASLSYIFSNYEYAQKYNQEMLSF